MDSNSPGLSRAGRAIALALVLVLVIQSTGVAAADDTARPYIEWDSPWDRGKYAGVPEGDDDDDSEPDWVVNDGTLHLNATIHDESKIESVTIRRNYQANDVNGRPERDQKMYRLGSTTQINETIHLGTYGNTTLTIKATDAAGNTRVARVVVDVDDNEPPTADLSAKPAGEGEVRVQGTVTDHTQVDKVRLRSVSGERIITTQQGSVDLTKNTATIDTRIEMPAEGIGGSVEAELQDREGNTRTISVPVEAETTSTPTPTETPTTTPTATATPTATTTATATPEPTDTQTATQRPSPTPESDGPGSVINLSMPKMILVAGAFIVVGVGAMIVIS